VHYVKKRVSDALLTPKPIMCWCAAR